MDFLETIITRNVGLIKVASEFYARGEIHEDTYVLDLDTLRKNASTISRSADEYNVETYFESKQFGRNPLACQEVMKSGMTKAVAIDMEEAKSLHRTGINVGHVGHLGQIPRKEVRYVLEEIRPEVITVYNVDKAAQISEAAKQLGHEQKLLLKVIGDGDLTYNALGGGIKEHELVSVAREINSLQNVTVAGLTTYPSLRCNLKTMKVEPTPNFNTLIRCKKSLRMAGFEIEQVNAPGMNTASTMKILEENGGTHAEPGQALIGMTPLHALNDEPEIPGMVYVTEVDNVEGDKAFAYGSGFVANVTVGVWNPLAYEHIYALVGYDFEELLAQRAIVEPPLLQYSDPSFFMYLTLRKTPGTTLKVGQTVITGCRGQVYRANSAKLAVVEGIQNGKPKVMGIYDRNGVRLAGPSDSPVN